MPEAATSCRKMRLLRGARRHSDTTGPTPHDHSCVFRLAEGVLRKKLKVRPAGATVTETEEHWYRQQLCLESQALPEFLPLTAEAWQPPIRRTAQTLVTTTQ